MKFAKQTFNVIDAGTLSEIIEKHFGIKEFNFAEQADYGHPYGSFMYFKVKDNKISNDKWENEPNTTLEEAASRINDEDAPWGPSITDYVAKLMIDEKLPKEDLLVWIEY